MYVTSELFPIQSALANLDAALGQVTGAADQEFVAIGNTLGQAVEVFGRLGHDLTELAAKLHSEDARSAVFSLEQAVGSLSAMSQGENVTGPLLAQLDTGSAEVEKRLDSLQRILGEAGALAVNGKIQAALVTKTGVDFSVFTTEIGRLGHVAELSTQRAVDRLSAVRAAVASARDAAADFERNEARELEVVRTRINASLSSLAGRRQMAASTVNGVAAKSKEIAQRIAVAVSKLQINDSVCQRIEHVRHVVKAVRLVTTGDAVADSAYAWLQAIPAERQPALVRSLCALQASQLQGGVSDFRADVEDLVVSLSALAAAAADVLSDAETAFGGSDGGLFVSEIERDIGRASELLAVYTAARDRTQSVVGAVSSGFDAMAADLADIQSIVADMRIMGLNATLKCGRIGSDGRALGVIAQELRTCSKRTEDSTHGIAELLEKAFALSDALAAATTVESTHGATEPTDVIAQSMAALTALGESMSVVLGDMRAEAGGVSTALSKTASEIDIHDRMQPIAEEGAGGLKRVRDALANDAGADETDHEELWRLVSPLYTMDAERLIHQSYSGGLGFALSSVTLAADSGGDDVDALFF